MTITNNSEYVIVAENRFLTVEIPIGEKILIGDDEVNGDYKFTFKLFSKKQKKDENLVDVRRTLGNRFGIWVSMATYIPMQTTADLRKCTEAVITDEKIGFHFLTFIFKKISLCGLRVDNEKYKQKRMFVNDADRRYFLRWLLVELLVTFLIAPILIYSSITAFMDAWGWLECTVLCIITALYIYSYIRKIIYFTRYKKQ